MSVGPMGAAASAAGAPFAQGQGSEATRAQQESAEQARQTNSTKKAEDAAGIGQTEQDEEASDRDADGRRLWEGAPEEGNAEQDDPTATGQRSKDATGEKGGQLDLSG